MTDLRHLITATIADLEERLARPTVIEIPRTLPHPINDAADAIERPRDLGKTRKERRHRGR